MAKDAASSIGYLVRVDKASRGHLAAIRHWQNLKLAFDGDRIWIKDIWEAQLQSVELKSIPYKTVFYERDTKLYPLGSLLPSGNIPAVLWTPIERALPIDLPAFNHNYFGVDEKVSIKLIPSEKEVDAMAMITTIASLEQYMNTAPAVRLQPIMWTILNNDKALLIGKPLLPLNGQAFWQMGRSLLPAGYELDLHILNDTVCNMLDPGRSAWILWDTDSTYTLVDKADLQSLSRSSFRLSKEQFALR
ncbi:MAG: hypothetical protein EOO06_00200 [Chitinophagaceae bacterium]|nr:MAG: hypothetical protein EOO06_00200 [Chitinophagaceae bacterium]